jgi:1,4-dihydroxy-2-naphthoyl-CoA hydrolase
VAADATTGEADAVSAQPDLGRLLESMPFAVATGVVLERAAPREVTGSLAWAPERCTAGGSMHGGALMTLADSVGAVCAFLNLPPGATGTATTSSTTSFLRALRRGSAHATARPLHVGRTSVVLVVEVVDDGGALVAHVTQSQVVLGGQRL